MRMFNNFGEKIGIAVAVLIVLMPGIIFGYILYLLIKILEKAAS